MIPKYEIIKNDIIRMITEEKEFKAGDKIYSEGELKKMYNVSSTTVVKALNDLVLSGYLIRKQGEGTFVRKNLKHRRAFFDEGSPYKEMRIANHKANKEDTKLIQLIEEKVPEIARKMDLPENTVFIHMIRMGYINGIPWKLQNNYIPKQFMENFTFEGLRKGGSFSDEIKSQTGINLMSLPMKQHIEVIFPIKNEEILRMWEIDANTPLFKIDRLIYYPAQQPYVYIENYVHYQYYSIDIQTEENVM